MTKFIKGNTHRAKPLDQHQTAKVVVALTPEEKSDWKQFAYPKTVSHMIRKAVASLKEARNG